MTDKDSTLTKILSMLKITRHKWERMRQEKIVRCKGCGTKASPEKRAPQFGCKPIKNANPIEIQPAMVEA